LLRAGCEETADGALWRDPGGLAELGRVLAGLGAFSLRDEEFDVRGDRDGVAIGSVIGQIDRGALPYLGIAACGVHVNGLVRKAGGLFLWVAKRAADKKLDPGKLDHLIAGGIGAGFSVRETLIKEAGEEAGVPPAFAATARFGSAITYQIARDEGLRRDVLFCYDIEVDEDFIPRPMDGEVESFALWPIERVMETVAAGDEYKFNVNLVLIDLFVRLGLVPLADLPGYPHLLIPRALCTEALIG